jgi:hypothetical protein
VVAAVTRARRVAVGRHREVRLRLVGIPVAISTRNRMAMRQRELAERRVHRWQGSRLDREQRAIDLGRIGRHARHGVVHWRWWRRSARQRDAGQSNTHGQMVTGWPPRVTSATGAGPEPDIAVMATRRSDERAAHDPRASRRRHRRRLQPGRRARRHRQLVRQRGLPVGPGRRWWRTRGPDQRRRRALGDLCPASTTSCTAERLPLHIPLEPRRRPDSTRPSSCRLVVRWLRAFRSWPGTSRASCAYSPWPASPSRHAPRGRPPLPHRRRACPHPVTQNRSRSRRSTRECDLSSPSRGNQKTSSSPCLIRCSTAPG